MKKRIAAVAAVVALLFSGCNERLPAAEIVKNPPVPAWSLLVVPFDRFGAQAFLKIRFNSDGEATVLAFPRETVFENMSDETTLYATFADGKEEKIMAVFDAFCQNGVPIDCILSVNVSDPDIGLSALLSTLGNNLLFTNPPAFVYTVCNVKSESDSPAISAAEMRRVLTISPEKWTSPPAYAAFRALAAKAVLEAGITAFSGDEDAALSAFFLAGSSTLTPAEEAAARPLIAAVEHVRVGTVAGTFVGEGSRLRFYPFAF